MSIFWSTSTPLSITISCHTSAVPTARSFGEDKNAKGLPGYAANIISIVLLISGIAHSVKSRQTQVYDVFQCLPADNDAIFCIFQ